LTRFWASPTIVNITDKENKEMPEETESQTPELSVAEQDEMLRSAALGVIADRLQDLADGEPLPEVTKLPAHEVKNPFASDAPGKFDRTQGIYDRITADDDGELEAIGITPRVLNEAPMATTYEDGSTTRTVLTALGDHAVLDETTYYTDTGARFGYVAQLRPRALVDEELHRAASAS
jgi:hypothetical protein